MQARQTSMSLAGGGCILHCRSALNIHTFRDEGLMHEKKSNKQFCLLVDFSCAQALGP